jgi:L-alanine-DL-glutamate epimerase-like enolase superfamily enzyme
MNDLGCIEKVEARTVIIPLACVARIARRTLRERHYTFVRIYGENGETGIGFTIGGAPTTTIVRESIAPRLQNQDVAQGEGLWEELYHDLLLIGRRGAAIRALSAADIAIWDLKAKLIGLTLAQLLGIYRDPVPAYASGGYYIEGSGLRELEREVASYAESGFDAVKIKVGGLSVAEDVERVRGVRRMLGDDAKLMLDANNCWPDYQSALRAIRPFEEFDIEWIEEPLSPDDVDGHRRLAETLDIAVATGEIEATRWGFLPLIRDRAADVIQADASVVGGISEWRKIASTASSFDIPVAPHWFADLHVHCVASIPNGIWIEYFTDTGILNVMKLFEQSLRVERGLAYVPREPGLGVALKESEVERYAVDGWA